MPEEHEIVTVERVPTGDEATGDDWERWVNENTGRIGYCGKEYLYYGAAPIDFTWHRGQLFRADKWENVFYSVERSECYPNVLCRDCFGDEFLIYFGETMPKIECTGCGNISGFRTW